MMGQNGEGGTRPRPPAPPRCPECGGPHGSKAWQPRHLPDCSIAQAADAHWANVRGVEAALAAAVRERRSDREFMARLRRNIEKHADLLDLLADEPTVHSGR